ncbi:MAG TPA: c-type cytochrome biogenesis protein CcsB [Rhodocyclaceae bacterium]
MELAQAHTDLPLLRRLRIADWLAAFALLGGGLFALARYGAYMDGYEKAILLASIPGFVYLAWSWAGLRNLMGGVALLALAGINLYHGDLARADHAFFLKFLLSSQTAIGWMCALFFMATGAFWLGLAARAEFADRVGTALTWSAVTAGLTGLLVRWYESYLIGADVGHIPVSNLYEVFVLFSLITGLLYLHYAGRYATRKMGAFVLPVISAAVGFLLWYTFSREAQEIQPLVPALQSYWMKIHVPANFVGYGAFALSAMLGVAWICASKGILADRLPSPEVLEDVMYKAIAVGFAFFTIATILGALWAAEAWGTYWQWDPKETWALIVWLNYAAWLHMRLTKGLRGAALAWWAVTGLLVTTFAFLGVNMVLSGLHSYGTL